MKNQTVRAEKLKFKITKKKIGFLVIAHRGSHGFGPDLVGIFPRSLPELFEQLRDQNNNQKLLMGPEPSDFRPQDPAIGRSGRVESESEVKNAKIRQLELKN